MRRGLISWSKAELPEATLDARIKRGQAAMAAAGVDALAIYTDPSRTAGASWFTGFVPYWNELLIILPKTGKPFMVTGMSNRVNSWIRKNAYLEDVVNIPKIGPEAGRRIAEMKVNAVVAIPELDRIPGVITAGITAGNSLSLVDGTAIMEKSRGTSDPAEVAMYAKAGEIARRALRAANVEAKDGGTLSAPIENEARRGGAEEVYIAVAPDLERDHRLVRLEGVPTLGKLFAVRVSVAYKGAWVRMTRTMSADPKLLGDTVAMTERFVAAIAGLPKTDGFKDFASWQIEGCRGIQQLELFMATKLDDSITPAPGSIVSVQATLKSEGRSFLIAAPVMIGRAGEAASPLILPNFNDAT